MTKISVIIPCYNQEKYIAECLDSIIAQTFNDFEAIVVNDGSTDNSLTIIKEYAKKDKRIKIINQINQGVVVARNNAIKQAKGEFIYPLDGDDKIAPQCLEQLYAAMIEGKGDVIYSQTEFFGNKKGLFELPLPTKDNMVKNNCIVCSALYKKKDALKYGLYDINMKNGLEDWELWISFILDDKKFYRLSETLFFYRQLNNSRNVTIETEAHKKLLSYINKKHKIKDKEKPIIYKVKGRNGKRKIYLFGIKIFSYKKLNVKFNRRYVFKKNRYKNSFLCRENNYNKKLKPIDKIVYCFWTGDNELTENRKSSLSAMQNNIGVKVKLITKDNWNDYILPEYPLHSAFKYLSCVHKSDYLRCYFMHHHGGGYTDVKEHKKSWLKAFEKLSNSNKYILGYREIGEIGVAQVAGTIGKDLRNHWKYLIGNGAYISRPYTSFTTDWYVELHKRMDEYAEELKNNPGNVWGDNEGYPILWTNILGDIFHPLCLKYHNKILQSDDIKPSFDNYR